MERTPRVSKTLLCRARLVDGGVRTGRHGGVREVLNEIRWHPKRDPSGASIFYRDREAPEGSAVTRGDEIEKVGASSFTVRGATIPFYKVFRVVYGSEVLFERDGPREIG